MEVPAVKRLTTQVSNVGARERVSTVKDVSTVSSFSESFRPGRGSRLSLSERDALDVRTVTQDDLRFHLSHFWFSACPKLGVPIQGAFPYECIVI